MKDVLHGFRVVAAAAVVSWTATALATPIEQASLDKCQKTVAKEGEKYVKLRVKAVARCLQAISGELVKKGSGAQRAAPACVAQLRRINDSRGEGKSLEDKMRAKIERSCDPATTPHSLADLLGTGAGVPQSLRVENLDGWCSHFGGDGAIDSLEEWLDCVATAHACHADQAISLQYPRVLEWLILVRTEMQALAPPAGDPSRVADAVAALEAVALALDGDEDGVLDLTCGPSIQERLAFCQDDLDACDADLTQALDDLGACNSDLGACQDDLTACNADLGSCQNDLGACNDDLGSCQDDLTQLQSDLTQAQANLDTCQDALGGCPGLPATGQMTSFGSGSDGDLQPGRARLFTDNGDGTITDHVTGLMWEKKRNFNNVLVDCSGEAGSCADPHDVDNRYTWCASLTSTTCVDPGNPFDGTVVTVFLEQLNHRCDTDPSVECKVEGNAACELALGAGELCGFAGYRDWRLPNVIELHSLVNYEEPLGFNSAPAVFPAFNTGCSSSCNVKAADTCSCTRASGYVSSTTYAGSPSPIVWRVVFGGSSGIVDAPFKSQFLVARAVRGGL